MHTPISPRKLRALECVLNHKTITAAAEHFNVTQPAMSRLISQLEEDVGFPLLTRERGRFELTPVGVRFWAEAKVVLESMRRLSSFVGQIQQNSAGTIEITALPGLINVLISRPLSAFSAEHPEIKISIGVQNRAFIENFLVDNHFDIALVTLPINIPPTIEIQPLMILRAICIVPKNHPLSKKAEIFPEDLRGVPFVSFQKSSLVRERIDTVFEQHEIKRAMQYETHSVDIVCEMVGSGMGVSIITPMHSLGTSYDVVEIPFSPEIAMTYAMLRPANRGRTPHVDKLVGMIVNESSKLSSRSMVGD
ncbi:LysR substrate-binding domain protein [Bordetella bronchiseptica MBORD678]|uniref:LysR substrate-binding domain-containing protein n=1 Tax=Bordetella bronchiseptica TaxID=518 RepID=UPI000461ACF5|nr:LysR substrate-binding domain-containing protein [Bordetella bronchiseptica]AWP80653.1 hypothetical protein B7P04_15615 [Bordetella bronchiseptica]KAB1444017.1 LysR family transcriptional regulator [Bordetella bronchiseptica]KAB1568800.1 LysR family transcriptional regulator [Bordetella bronchiseptica]KDC35524.1 LysR substrate-binding domain protein [Bordetella bronchiseptica M435/02/3]KDC60310.1 LysR substrate-binding domain protein [Bordetella bronchiseptica MBORD595]